MEALRGFAASADVIVFTDVPVVGPGWRGWGSRCPRRVLDVAAAALGTGDVSPFAEDDFIAAIASGRSIHPLNTWGFAPETPSRGQRSGALTVKPDRPHPSA